MADPNDKPQKLTNRQREIIERLGDKTYTAAYIEAWMNRQDNVFSNAPAALMIMGVHGYLTAVNNMERADGERVSNDEE